MITIDGGYLEGGGQVVRGAVALSALSGEPVTLTNIRKNRSKPGLAAQHLAAVRAVAALCSAECKGLSRNSTRLTFVPRSIAKTECHIDVGTAGSIPLVLQAWLPIALRFGGSLAVTGGTEVSRSPTIDYFDRVFCNALRQHGAHILIEVLQRGYYPQGGGSVNISVDAVPLPPLEISPSDACGIISCSSNLPSHVAERQAASAAALLFPHLGDLPIMLDHRSGTSTGSSCTVWSGWKGGSALGRRGYPAENVGADAARSLIEKMGQAGTVDIHMADQLIIPVAVFGGCFTTAQLTLHSETMVWLAGEFGYDIEIREGDAGVIEVSA
jgi:RNA 3'-terminal phosphate cyclase (ATP)